MNEMFLNRMKEYLGEEYETFEQSLERPLYRGLSMNPKKITREQLISELGNLQPSPFYSYGYYVDRTMGNHPFHLSGAFYLQEPSASCAVEILNVQPSDTVLDLCAAPGGKSAQIASALGSGFLVANEYDPKRARILSSNLERMGVGNVLITQGDVKFVCEAYASCFDKVLVDAPCSGEGMMKKHDAARDEWSLANIEHCAKRQSEILDQAYKALKKDGILVYSTCTYAKEENEEVIAGFLKRHPDMVQEKITVSFGRPGLSVSGVDPEGCRRIFPMDQGEGHFICRLRKMSGACHELPLIKEKKDQTALRYVSEHLKAVPGWIRVEKDKVFIMDHPFVQTQGVRCIRQGIFAGTIIKNRFEPEHGLYMAYPKDAYQRSFELDEKETDDAMHGEVIHKKSEKGYGALCYKGQAFGFGKSDGKVIKNKIPKGLRLLPNSHTGG